MTWVSLLLLAWGVADLWQDPRRPAHHAWACIAVLVPLFLLTGAWRWADVVVALVGGAAYVGWAWVCSDVARARPRQFMLAMAALLLPVLTAVALAGESRPVGGPAGRWLAWSGVTAADAERVLLLAGAVMVQLSTANMVVRLVLAQVRLVPAREPGVFEAEHTLKGGRFVGPLERILLLLLGLAGQLTAGTLIAAAKGIIRFPELRRDDPDDAAGTAEYVLVGTLASWAFAIVTFVLVR